ncbi:hypothetical protein DFJ74DRAFT_773762 [Hyaloraphidium curvatum]|nr:hypothetical protein DFJ74DRAFT_773762 [Hyaloraphidium curvatum]
MLRRALFRVLRFALFLFCVLLAAATAMRGRPPREPPDAPAGLGGLLLSALDPAALPPPIVRGPPDSLRSWQQLAFFGVRFGLPVGRPLRPAGCVVAADLAAGSAAAHSNQVLGVVRAALLARDVLGCRLIEPAFSRPRSWATPEVPVGRLYRLDGWKLADGSPLFLSADEAAKLGVPDALLPVLPGRNATVLPRPRVACAVEPFMLRTRAAADYPPNYVCASVTVLWNRPGLAADLLAAARAASPPGIPPVVAVPFAWGVPIRALPGQPSLADALSAQNALPLGAGSLLPPQPWVSRVAQLWLSAALPSPIPGTPDATSAPSAELTAFLASPGGPCPPTSYSSAHVRARNDYATFCRRLAAGVPGRICGTDLPRAAEGAAALGCGTLVLSSDLHVSAGLRDAVVRARAPLCPGQAGPVIDLSTGPFDIPVAVHRADPPVAEELASYAASHVLLACGARYAGTRRSSYSERAASLRMWAGREAAAEYLPALEGAPSPEEG